MRLKIWNTLIHVGEGRGNHTVLCFDYEAAKDMVEASLESVFPTWVKSFRDMIQESKGIEVPSGKSVHRALHEEDKQVLTGIHSFSELVDRFVPKDLCQTVSVKV